jgi:hypothetical protein
MFTLIFGTIIGGAIGFMSAYAMWKIQIKQNRKNIAQGFFLELDSLEGMLKAYADVFSNPGSGVRTAAIEQPLYEDGLFLAYRKELFSFDKDLAKHLFEFYTTLLTAERNRQIDKSSIFFGPANKEMKDAIKKANKMLPQLKELLKKEFE